MKKLLLILSLNVTFIGLKAQYVHKIKADSVLITNDSCNAELNLENGTRHIKGFLYNKGNGRTEFRKGVVKINDSLYLIGADTLNLNTPLSVNAWLQGGNSWGTTGIMGTLDNNHLDFYTNNIRRGRWSNTGNLLIGTTDDNGYKLKVNGPTNINLLSDQEYLIIKLQGFTNWARGIDFNISDSDGVSNSYGIKLVGYNQPGTGNRILRFNQYNATQTIFSGGSYYFEGKTYFVNTIANGYHADFAIHLAANTMNPNPTGIKFYSDNYSSSPIMSIMEYGKIGIGTADPTAQLHTTSSVRLQGLTNNDTLTRVVVCDINGNLFYKNVSSLALNSMMNAAAPDAAATPGEKATDKKQITLLEMIEKLTLSLSKQEEEIKSLKKEIAELKELVVNKTNQKKQDVAAKE